MGQQVLALSNYFSKYLFLTEAKLFKVLTVIALLSGISIIEGTPTEVFTDNVSLLSSKELSLKHSEDLFTQQSPLYQQPSHYAECYISTLQKCVDERQSRVHPTAQNAVSSQIKPLGPNLPSPTKMQHGKTAGPSLPQKQLLHIDYKTIRDTLTHSRHPRNISTTRTDKLKSCHPCTNTRGTLSGTQ